MRSYLVAWVLIIFKCDYIKSDILFENLTEIIEEIQKKTLSSYSQDKNNVIWSFVLSKDCHVQ